MSGEPAPELVGALQDAQQLGFLGARPISEVIDHARGFVRALEGVGEIVSVLDLGSGGGVPGLVIAHDLPDTRLTLLDRRAKRTDALERFVRRLGWQDRVVVRCEDVATFTPDQPFDAVVARGFGPPDFTLSSAARFVRSGGLIVISEPPGTNRWEPALLDSLDLRRSEDPLPARRPAEATELDGLVVVFVKH